MRQRTLSEIKAYGDGYAEAYKEFCHLLERHDKDKAIRKMKIFADAVALTVETAIDTADTPQTERIKTPDYCDICNHKGCDNCIANNLDDYCVPSGYEPITKTETENSNLTFETDTPQTEICDTCKYRSSNVFGNWCVGRDTCDRYEADTPQTETKTETQNSNLTFEKRTMLDCYNCKRYKSDDACVECRYEPKDDTPQTEPSEEEIREAIIDGCKRSAKFSKVISTSQTEQTDCDTCKYAQIADEHCEFCGEAYIDNYEPQTESYYTDATHFGKAKGESTTTNTADTPQTDCNKCIWNVCNYNKVEWDADTPQTEESCERCVYVRGSQWCQGCNGTPKRWDGEKIVDTPQTEERDEK